MTTHFHAVIDAHETPPPGNPRFTQVVEDGSIATLQDLHGNLP
jgi:hypothetical protein